MIHEDFMTELFQPVVEAAAIREAASPDAEARAALRSVRQQTKLTHPFLNDKQLDFIIDAAVGQIALGGTDDDLGTMVAREARTYAETIPFDATATFDGLLARGRR